MRFRRIAPVAAILIAGTAVVMASPPGPARAATVTGLPITSVYQMLADTAHGHLFISQGPDGEGGPIVVTNLSGTPLTTIGDGAYGLALSADDQTLYAATGDAVTAFSTSTLKQTASYPAPGRVFQVAVQSGRLWVSYEDGDLATVGGINLAVPTAPWDSVPVDWAGIPPEIAADPSDSGMLVVAAYPSSGGPAMATFDVANPSAVSPIASTSSSSCGYDQPSVLPGGKNFLCGGFSYSTSTLTADSSAASYPGYTEVAPDGAVAVGDFYDVLGYPAGATAPTASYDEFYGLPVPPGFVASYSSPVGLAWGANSQQLFAVIESISASSSHVYSLLTLDPFERVPTNLTLTSTATTVPFGATATITAHLGFTYGPPDFSVYDAIVGQSWHQLWSGLIEPNNTITTSESSFTRNTIFLARFGGDSHYGPATVSLEVEVGVKVASAVSGYYKTAVVSGLDYRVYHHTSTLKELVTVTPAKPDECVKFETEQGHSGVWGPSALTGCVALNKSSQALLTRKLGPTGWFRVRADFRPSAKDTANVATDGGWVYYEVTS